MSTLKPKKIFLIISFLILLTTFLIFNHLLKDPAPPILRSIYPYFQIEKLPDDPNHYTFGNYEGFEFDFYAKEVVVGGTPFFLTVENKPNQRSIYRFYAIGLQSEPVAEIEWGMPVTSSKDAFVRYLTFDDLNADGIKELFVRTRSEEGHLSYAIFKEWHGSLRPISFDANFEDWINVQYVGTEGDVIYFVTATSDDPSNEEFDDDTRQKFYLAGDSIVTEAEVLRTKQASDFNQDLYEATQDPVWRNVAIAFQDSCETLPGSVLNGQGLPFRAMIKALEPVKTTANGNTVYIIPCMLHAYQTSEMAAIYNGATYEPLTIETMDYEGNRDTTYAITGLSYDPSRDLFTTYGKGRGMGDCGAGSELKLEGTTLVLQKMEADKECDGEYESEVIFDILAP